MGRSNQIGGVQTSVSLDAVELLDVLARERDRDRLAPGGPVTSLVDPPGAAVTNDDQTFDALLWRARDELVNWHPLLALGALPARLLPRFAARRARSILLRALPVGSSPPERHCSTCPTSTVATTSWTS